MVNTPDNDDNIPSFTPEQDPNYTTDSPDRPAGVEEGAEATKEYAPFNVTVRTSPESTCEQYTLGGETVTREIYKVLGNLPTVTAQRRNGSFVQCYVRAVTVDGGMVQVIFPKSMNSADLESNHWLQKWVSLEKIFPRIIFR